MTDLNSEVSRRRTFAIISHPDAGKTTLTEKFLVIGGAIKMAGAVKARGEQRRAHSDRLTQRLWLLMLHGVFNNKPESCSKFADYAICQ